MLNLFKKVRRYYKQSKQVHMLVYKMMRAPTAKEKIEVVKEIRKANEQFDERGLPKWVSNSIEWYLSYLEPLLFPFGSHQSLLMMKIRRFFKRQVITHRGTH